MGKDHSLKIVYNTKIFIDTVYKDSMKSVVLFLLLLQTSFPAFNQVAEHTFDGYAEVLFTADITDDGLYEIVVWDKVDSVIICYDYKLHPVWTVEIFHPVIAAGAEDLNDSGTIEIFILTELEKTSDFYPYRLYRIEADGAVPYRKYMETSIQYDFAFHFINADGKPGKEVVITNRILVSKGLERMAFGWDRAIVETVLVDDTPYFLVYVPNDAVYELYGFDEDTILWQGQACDISSAEAELQDVLCTLFMKAGICICREDWVLTDEPLKSVWLWSDITGDGKKEALFYTEKEVTVTAENTQWTWESPTPIDALQVTDITGDTCSEIVVKTTYKGVNTPSLYILDCNGVVQSAVALNISEDAFIFFSDLDDDTDVDLVVGDSKSRKSTLRIYTNNTEKGLLDQKESLGRLKVVDPSSVKTTFWILISQYYLLVLLGVVVLGALFVVVKKRKRE